MAQAESHATTTASRRRFLMTAPAAALAIHTGAPIGEPDADLLDLGRQLRAAWAAENETAAKWAGTYTAEAARATTAAADTTRAIAERIEKLPATTLAGVRVKVDAVSWCCSGEPFEDDTFCHYAKPTTEVRIVSSILRDLLAMPAAALS